MRLADLSLVDCLVTDEHVGETLRHFKFKAGQLVLVDRGYANPPGIHSAVVKDGAHVLVRYNFGSLPLYDQHGNVIDVEARLSKLGNRGEPREWAAWVHPKGQKPALSM